jgi:EAL and modified HD-GYP domain-containing signal transduction protein
MSLQTTSKPQFTHPVAEAAQHAKGLESLQRFLTRQPVLNSEDQVIGYELKRRDGVPLEVLPGARSLRQAQDEHLLVSAIDLEFQKALGNKLTFLSVSPDILLNPLIEQLPKDKVVLAIHPGDYLDPAIPARAEELARQGLILALDDMPDTLSISPLLAASRYIRMDTTRYDVISLAERVAQLQRGPGQKHFLIATQVDTQEVFESCTNLGFELFQGYYFAQLTPSKPSRMDANVMRVMDLLNKVLEQADVDVLEKTFKLDPALSYKLLRYINSPAIGLRSTINSIGHAVSLLGYDQTYRWLTLLLFSSVRATARNQTLLRNALARAHFTEALGREHMEPAQRGGLFITGMFSQLDALLNIPMTQALANLNLPDAVANALVHGDGPYAPYLELATACEHFDQEAIAALAADANLDADTVNLAHVNALIWSESIDI